MKYYKVNKIGDQVFLYRYKIMLIENELFTDKERIKYNIPLKYLEKKDISKNNIFFSFGCRFEIKGWNQPLIF